ncbi:anaerobic sulfatase maturase [Gracilibacillus phocaeensis]|uniref:anaerobic sulfatase maturase n=1 Tax=Gracilibacillus phocaeensis TaxID=2042304 RepID=UPI002570FAB7|nr:anaerobic sulfatase maturase [Gracilibacillus phocaeensis]
MVEIETPVINRKQPMISGVMWKTVSGACNLACDYCYYSRCGGRAGHIERIKDEVLEKFIKEYMAASNGVVSFAWQGGEPLLAGLPFFEKVVALQAKHAPKRTMISNSIQTNGTMINEKWAAFFKKYNFLVGVSIDGPEEINDQRRVTSTGKGSYQAIMKGIQHLRDYEVDFNVLTVIHENNVHHAKALMDFYQREQFDFVQFIPCMDFQSQHVDQPGVFHITPREYGDFLCESFHYWYNDGDPKLSIRFFDNILAVLLHQQAELCVHQEMCPKMLVLEQNGDAYPCDFFIHEDYRLGNVGQDTLSEIAHHEKWDDFLAMKPNLPDQCKQCEFLSLCHGGCPRNRVSDQTTTGVDYFCESYQQVYRYANKKITKVAQKIRKTNINHYYRSGEPLPGRNELCLCGSNKKFKKCCEPLLDRV